MGHPHTTQNKGVHMKLFFGFISLSFFQLIVNSLSAQNIEVSHHQSCGIAGDLQERIKDCEAFMNRSSGHFKSHDRGELSGSQQLKKSEAVFEWHLVSNITWQYPITQELNSKTLVGYEPFTAQAWLDSTSGLVWSDRSMDSYSRSSAKAWCENSKHYGIGQKGLLGDQLSFRLPSSQEFEQAFQHGLKNILPGVSAEFKELISSTGNRAHALSTGFAFWTSDGIETNAQKGVAFDPFPFLFSSKLYKTNIKKGLKVLCVADTNHAF